VTVYRTLPGFAIPASLLVAAGIAVPHIAELPAPLAGLKVYGVWLSLLLGSLVSLAFMRGRALFALLTLAAAYAGYRYFLQHGSPPQIAYAVYAAICLFVPANLAALALLRERGVFNRHGLMRLIVLAVEVLCASWLALPGNTATVEWLYASAFGTALPGATPLPQLGIAVLLLAFAAGIAAWFATRSAVPWASPSRRWPLGSPLTA
jgi:hypothetical protein